MTCKDCIHYEVCFDHLKKFHCEYLTKDFEREYEKHPCELFKDKSRFVELPCKAGDTVFFDTYKRGEEVGIQPHKVIRVDVIATTEGFTGATLYAYDFGKTVFFTREEAEKKLEELKK